MDTARVKGPLGFVAGAVSAGIKPSGNPDLAAFVCERPATTAAVTTSNRLCSPTIVLCKERLARRAISRGVLVNAGIANTATGERGMRDAVTMAFTSERVIGGAEGEMLVFSTGRVGEFLPMHQILGAIPRLMRSLSPGGWEAFSQGIMTTDTRPKLIVRTFPLPERREATVLGVVKGAGMIFPNMATLLAFVVTDYPRGADALASDVRAANTVSFNSLTIDADQSTNDVFLCASSGLALRPHQTTSDLDKVFSETLTEVATALAKEVARDGEGATKLVTITVLNAFSRDESRSVALTVANSNLVKTAIRGRDPNWGRIFVAMGNSGVDIDPSRCSIRLQGQLVCEGGCPVPFDRQSLHDSFCAEDVHIDIDLRRGSHQATVWTCDLTEEYIRINADYTT